MIDDPDNKELERLETELRQLPQPSLPADLEARLLTAIPKPVVKRRRFRILGFGLAAAAAGLLIAFAIFFVEGERKRKPQSRLAAVDVNRLLLRECAAARLNAATQILATKPGGKKIAEETYRYLARNYPDTQTGKQLIRWRNEP
jgi:hypothetical protein